MPARGAEASDGWNEGSDSDSGSSSAAESNERQWVSVQDRLAARLIRCRRRRRQCRLHAAAAHRESSLSPRQPTNPACCLRRPARAQNEFCQACGGTEGMDRMLRCGSCPNQYHPGCLAAEERQPPRAAQRWACPQCTRRERLGRGIDKFLALRGGGTGREFRVKWAGRSHLHCEWVKEANLDDAAAVYRGLKGRLGQWLKKRDQLAQVGRGGGAEAGGVVARERHGSAAAAGAAASAPVPPAAACD